MTTQDDMRTGLALAIARDGGNQPDVKNINDVLWKEDYLRFADAALAFLRTRLLSDEAVEQAARALRSEDAQWEAVEEWEKTAARAAIAAAVGEG